MSANLVTDLGNGISCIDTLLHEPGIAACYLIEQDGVAGFIDTGTSKSLPILMDALQRRKLTPEQVAYVMPTHVHLDHAGGVGEVMAACPNATLLIHPRGARHMIDPAKLEQGSLAVYGEEKFAQLFGRLLPVPEERVQSVEDGFELDFNGRCLTFFHTEGHARHHYCIHDRISHGLFTGDTFGASYPRLNQGRNRFIFPPTTPIQFDPDAWLLTVDRLLAFKPERIFVTHFGMHEEPEKLGLQLKQQIKDYAETADDLANMPERARAIENSLTLQSVNFLLDQQCGLDPDEIAAYLRMDMALNAQGLEHWLTQRQ